MQMNNSNALAGAIRLLVSNKARTKCWWGEKHTCRQNDFTFVHPQPPTVLKLPTTGNCKSTEAENCASVDCTYSCTVYDQTTNPSIRSMSKEGERFDWTPRIRNGF